MKYKNIIIGYVYYFNIGYCGKVTKTGGSGIDRFTISGVGKHKIPYNYVEAKDLREPTLTELQEYIKCINKLH